MLSATLSLAIAVSNTVFLIFCSTVHTGNPLPIKSAQQHLQLASVQIDRRVFQKVYCNCHSPYWLGGGNGSWFSPKNCMEPMQWNLEVVSFLPWRLSFLIDLLCGKFAVDMVFSLLSELL